jgi:hypothetical protein
MLRMTEKESYGVKGICFISVLCISTGSNEASSNHELVLLHPATTLAPTFVYQKLLSPSKAQHEALLGNNA